jgi:hypothetical protein
MLLQLGAGLGGHRIVNQIIEQSEKFSAGHFSFLDSHGLDSADPFFIRK